MENLPKLVEVEEIIMLGSIPSNNKFFNKRSTYCLGIRFKTRDMEIVAYRNFWRLSLHKMRYLNAEDYLSRKDINFTNCENIPLGVRRKLLIKDTILENLWKKESFLASLAKMKELRKTLESYM